MIYDAVSDSVLDVISSPRTKTVVGASVATILVWRIVNKVIRDYFVRKYTIIPDLRSFGRSRDEGKRIKGTAVVCGGSIAGLWAARVCLDHFDEVIIIEPEAWLATEQGITAIINQDGEYKGNRHDRSRVLQYNAGHGFQVPMVHALRNAFPGFEEIINAHGGRIDKPMMNVYRSGIFVPMAKGAENILFMSRESFEIVLRRLVRQHPSSTRLRWVTGTVTGFKSDEKDRNKISGVKVRGEQGEMDLEIYGDLVIDCTGGTSAGLKWVKRWANITDDTPNSLAFDELRDEYNPHIHSVTFRFYIPPSLRNKLPLPNGYDKTIWFFTFSSDWAIEHRGLFGSRLEGNRIEIMVGAWGDKDLPTKPSQLRAFVESLRCAKPIPEFFLELLEKLSEVEEYTVKDCLVPRCHWIHYENVPSVPSNFVAIGDAVMRVNPIFGQGCTKACLGAITLDATLRSMPQLGPNFSKRFFASHKNKISGLWDGTKPIDYGFSTTEPMKGETLEYGHSARELTRLIMKILHKDEHINATLWNIRMMVAPPTDMMQPSILLKVAYEALKERVGLD